MIYSKTAEYAIRALTYISSKPAGSFVGVREISRQTGLPYAYIAKIFQALVRSWILKSCHGRKGGFMLKKNTSGISLMDIVMAVDNRKESPLSKCIMGLERCSDRNPCPLHPIWRSASEKMMAQLKASTVLDIENISKRFPQGKRNRQVLSPRMRGIFYRGNSK